MTPELAEKLDAVATYSTSCKRLGLSEFSHGRKWRDDLDASGIIEIVDRDKTAGWLLSWETLDAMTRRIHELEEALEEASVRELMQLRRNRTNYLSGAELADAAVGYLDEHLDAWGDAFDGTR